MAGKKKVHLYSEWPKPVFSDLVVTHKNYRALFRAAMMYAHYELSADDLKKEVVKYLKALDAAHPFLDRIKDMSESRLSTVGKYMYILNHGGHVPDDIKNGLMSSLEKSIVEEEAKQAINDKKNAKKAGANKEDETTPKVVVSIQDRLRDKAHDVAGEVEGWIDEFILNKKLPAKTVEEFVNLFKTFELKAPHMRHMYNIFEKRAEVISLAAEAADKDLAEGYSGYTKAEMKKLDAFHQNLLTACNMMQEVAKVERAPRKKKPVSQEKLVAKLKYKKEDNMLGIVSMNPVHIIGSKELWLYNTKTRKLAHYKALDEQGLSVKGASLLNYSLDSAEKTLRKPAETLSDFKKASKVKLRTFLKELSTLDTTCNGKVNEHHIILRIDK
jgi:hypothetical protein